jgi:hypothetical protein
VPPKHRVSQDPHDIISQKTTFFFILHHSFLCLCCAASALSFSVMYSSITVTIANNTLTEYFSYVTSSNPNTTPVICQNISSPRQYEVSSARKWRRRSHILTVWWNSAGLACKHSLRSPPTSHLLLVFNLFRLP